MSENIKRHSFCSEERSGIRIEGVTNVISFDEEGVALETLCGNMAIEGEGLSVTVLNVDEGRVEIVGRLIGIYYFDKRESSKRGLFGRKNA